MKRHAILTFLRAAGGRILRKRLSDLASIAMIATTAYLFFYFVAVLSVKSVSLTWNGLLLAPALVLAGALIAAPFIWVRFSSPRRTARYLERRFPELQLSLSACLDFLEGKADLRESPFHDAYLDQVSQKVETLTLTERSAYPWTRYALVSLLAAAAVWTLFQGSLLSKFYNPGFSFGQTHLNLSEGSITIFEPDYTQIPGRTLPLKPGQFQVFPGSRVRFMVQLPPKTRALYLASSEAEPVPLRLTDEGQASYEFVAMENAELRFLLSESESSGRTEPYRFEVKVDAVPELQLRSYTPEGPLNVLDPLIAEVEVKDDFGVKELQAVVVWGEKEKRIDIAVPGDRRRHFINRSQWFISDFDMGKVESFSLYFEAKDNNPITGPGVGRSQTLTYELESPDRKYDEFMEMARELLNTMTHALGDNLETQFATTLSRDNVGQARETGEQISEGLYHSLKLSNKLIGKVRETPNLTRMDQSFLYQFRSDVSRRARARSSIGYLYGALEKDPADTTYRRIIAEHGQEEVGVENLTYDLLMQLKMWAVLELERQNNQLQEDLDQLEELLENSENMDEQELQELFDRLMDEVMRNFQDMMSQVAEQMDMTMQEYMNSDAMEFKQDQFEDLRSQIMEALKEGDMEKARKLMEQLKAAMQESMNAMRQSMEQMSPEMMAMMNDMKELMGLLRELKRGEEELERDTQSLKQELDKQMGGNTPDMDATQQAEHRKATERIQELLSDLQNKLADYKTEGMSKEIIEDINEKRRRLEQEQLSSRDANELRRQINSQERMLDFLSRDGLDVLQNMTLQNLEQTEKLQEYLDQGEYMLSLETGQKLESSLLNGERVSEQTPSRQVQEDARPEETFREARQELYQILDALQNIRHDIEERRQAHMEQQGEQRQQGLSERQKQLEQMIQEFMERTEGSFDGSQIAEKLQDISYSMKGAEQQLRNSRLETGVRYEQAALQKIGEMMEQLQQSRRPSGMRPQFMMSQRRQEGFYGDPSLEDIFIPESQKKATKDKMKEAVRKQLKKNLPDAYGKEIRKYYEKLMDQ